MKHIAFIADPDNYWVEVRFTEAVENMERRILITFFQKVISNPTYSGASPV